MEVGSYMILARDVEEYKRLEDQFTEFCDSIDVHGFGREKKLLIRELEDKCGILICPLNDWEIGGISEKVNGKFKVLMSHKWESLIGDSEKNIFYDLVYKRTIGTLVP